MTQETVPVVDQAAVAAAQARQAQLTKPPGALGGLEALVIRLAGLQGRECPRIDTCAITVFAADHGVTAEGISAFPPSVTTQMVANFAAGGAAINALARHIGAQLEVLDVGTASDAPSPAGVRCERAGQGTHNLAEGPAMTREAREQATASGAAAAERAAAAGADLYIPGEMGIGNTTSAAAVACALLGARPEVLVGAGSGLDSDGVRRKIAVIERALTWHGDTLTGPDAIMERLGGYELAALMGAYRRAAQLGMPVLLDGFIATVAAIAAIRRDPGIAAWLIASHRSAELGHAHLQGYLKVEPLLDLGMRLGEASGAAVAVPLIRAACAVHAEMATFESAGITTGDTS
jgi:nicotinate-nucleotide--dimethylbenzimidazole phosphoribosyltransferase